MQKNLRKFAAIKLAFRNMLDQFQQALIDQQTALEYTIQQSLGDQNYYLTVTLPSLICEYNPMNLGEVT